jgi:hypothetical protein
MGRCGGDEEMGFFEKRLVLHPPNLLRIPISPLKSEGKVDG